MRKHYGQFLCGVAVLLSFAGADGSARAAEDEEKLKQMREMFKSPYTEESYYRTDRLLVTATGSQIPIHKAPSVASIITKEDIEDMGATTLDEVLETVPGLHVSVSQGAYFSSIWSIRGLHTSLNPQVLLLVNGVPFTTPANGTRPLTFKMPVAMISRVEVVRGPGSAVHGADAFAGTINVITKDAHEVNGFKAGARGGSFDTYDGWVQYGINAGGWDVTASVEGQRSGGDDDRIIRQDSYSFMRRNYFPSLPADGSLAPGPIDTRHELLNSHLNIRKGGTTFHLYSALHDNNAMGTGGYQVLSQGNEHTASNLLADLLHEEKNLLPDLDVSIRFNHLSMTEDIFLQYFPDNTRYQFGNPLFEVTGSTVESTALYKGWVDHRWRLAAGLKYWDMDTDQYRNFGADLPPSARLTGPLTNIRSGPYLLYMQNQHRALWHVSLQDEWHFARKWDLTAGIRHDYYDDFGATTNPRVALVWETLPTLTSKLLYGSAFRAPSFNEQYMTANPVALGNPNLAPEEVQTMELVFDYQPSSRFHPVLSIFSYSTDGLIDYVGSATNKTAQNSKDLRGQGFEVDVEWEPMDGFRFRTNFAYQRSKDTGTGEIAPNTPGMQFYLNPNWRFAEDWSLDGQFFWIGDRRRGRGDTRPEVSDYELVNLTLRRKNILKHWDVAIAARNLFDEDVREPAYLLNIDSSVAIPDDIPMPSRSFWAELRLSY